MLEVELDSILVVSLWAQNQLFQCILCGEVDLRGKR